MIVLLNGEFVPEERAVVSVFDRGFLYGDALFESLLVHNGKPFRWTQHLERLQLGAEFLGIHLPFSSEALEGFARELIEQNQMSDAVLRISLSRGVGLRGYSPKGAKEASLVMTTHPVQPTELQNPPLWHLGTSKFRLSANDPLAQFKTCNKLPQILARAEAESNGADEALLHNTNGGVAETSSGNVFWVAGGEVFTPPPLAAGSLPGVTRAVVIELCRRLGVVTREQDVAPDELREQAGVFVTLSSHGIVEVSAIDGQTLRRSELVGRLRESYWRLVRDETT